MAASCWITRFALKHTIWSHKHINTLFRISTCHVIAQSSTVPVAAVPGRAGEKKAEQISQAMKSYLQRAKTQNEFMEAEISEYEIGKRHLANIMGVDGDAMTQEDIDKAIVYLLPSGLTDKKARPVMKHPTDVIPRHKAAQFGIDGRPFHPLFYTGFSNFFQLLHDICTKYDDLKVYEDSMLAQGQQVNEEKRLILAGSKWLERDAIEKMLQEKLADEKFAHFLKIIERLATHPYSYREIEFIMRFRKDLGTHAQLQKVAPLLENEAGRKYVEAEGVRKSSTAHVRVTEQGSGEVIINSVPMIDYFWSLLDREQLLYPLQLTGLLGKVDIDAKVESGGHSGQAGALRLATAIALQSFVDQPMREALRLAGLLTRDPRVRERSKPGQEGARRKYTWKKR